VASSQSFLAITNSMKCHMMGCFTSFTNKDEMRWKWKWKKVCPCV